MGDAPDRERTDIAGRGMNDESQSALVKADADDHEDAEARAERLREGIRESRRQVSQNLERLQEEVSRSVDVQAWVDEHPWETVGVAFTVGFYLGFR